MRFLLTVVVTSCILMSPAFAQQGSLDCAPFPQIPVNITSVLDEAGYDLSTGIGGMQSLLQTPHLREKLLLGVTTFQPVAEITNHPREIKLANGGFCVKIMNVDIKLGYQNVVMHVANEIPQGTCGFNEVLAHEQKHVAVNQQLFQEYIPLIQQRLEEHLKLYGVIQQRNYGYAMTVLHDNMKNIIGQLMKEMDQQEAQRQLQVDSDAEFHHLVQICNGQLGQVAAHFRKSGR